MVILYFVLNAMQDEIFLLWYCGKTEKRLKLSSVTRIIPGQRTVSFLLMHFFGNTCAVGFFKKNKCYCNNFSSQFSDDTLSPPRNINLFLLFMATVLLIWLVVFSLLFPDKALIYVIT